MRTITYNDEAVLRDRNNHDLRTRLLPSSDDTDNKGSEIKTNKDQSDHTCRLDFLTMHTFCPLH
jgi:hypothetical protein